jgi:iron complex outermembrane receptor protein
MALTIIPFLFKIYMLPTQSREYAGAQFSNKKQLPNYFLQADFFVVWKTSFRNGLAFNTTIPCEIFAIQTKTFIPLGSMVTAAGLSIDLLKTRRFMRPLVRGFRHQFRKHWLPMSYTSLKPEIGWNYELGLKLHGLNNKLYTELTFLVLK